MLTVTKQGAYLEVYPPVDIDSKKFYLTSFWKDTTDSGWEPTGDCDEFNWLSSNHIRDSSDMAYSYDGQCGDVFPESDLFQEANTAFCNMSDTDHREIEIEEKEEEEEGYEYEYEEDEY